MINTFGIERGLTYQAGIKKKLTLNICRKLEIDSENYCEKRKGTGTRITGKER